ncbi:IQ motif-containing GTPase-activating protein 3 [Branchiostoma belcheri]|nr:IQ motif-containing GTPase-activating protein 3 [Branchiostoma belcheri]
MGTDYLNPADVQACVDQVNQEVQEEHDRIEAIATINDAIEAGDAATTLAALQIPAAKLADVEPRQAVHYQTILMQGKKAKAEETNDDSAVLWLEEIQEGVNTANRQAVEAEKLAVGIASINLAIDDADPAKTLEALKNPDVFLHRVLPECAQQYQASLEQAKASKLEQGQDSGSPWVEHKTRQGHGYYFNLETMESSWLPPDGFSSSRTHLSREEIQAALNDVTNAHDRQEEFEAHEDDIIKLQAHTRGMLARRRYKERLDYFHQQLPAVVKIQSHYRGYQQKKKYQDRLSVLHGNPWAVVKASLVTYRSAPRTGAGPGNRTSLVTYRSAPRTGAGPGNRTSLVTYRSAPRTGAGPGNRTSLVTYRSAPRTGAGPGNCTSLVTYRSAPRTGAGPGNRTSLVTYRSAPRTGAGPGNRTSLVTYRSAPRTGAGPGNRTSLVTYRSAPRTGAGPGNCTSLVTYRSAPRTGAGPGNRTSLVTYRSAPRTGAGPGNRTGLFTYRSAPRTGAGPGNRTSLIQAYAKMWRARRQYRRRLQYFNENVDSVVKLQAFFRSNMARHDYHLLTHSDNPPLSVVRKFVHLLDPNDVDYNEELEVQKLRGQVVQDIRANQELENNLNLMDIKIGLLVKNRITLQDVITHGKKLKKRQQSTSGGTSMPEKGGLKALHKDSRHKLEMYQNLFYLLQTNPVYLAKLIFEMPTGRTTKFMESVILSLYNYAANAREEYLLLKLFKTALQEEINNKVDKMMEIVTGNPMVIKMVVTFNRGTRGQSSLREIIQPLVLTIIKDKEMRINSNPIEVYKIWVNTMESKTGETSKLPYDVTTEQALQHPEVRERLEASISQLRNVTDKFLNTITSSADKIPYGMRFMAKVLKDSLHEKFPDATEAEVLKIVGNLLYYRYMNPAIVAPDGFDIIDVNAGVGLSPDQRRNLGSIAKLLQFAASNKIFDGENAHLSSLNDYVAQAHEKFKKFFSAACDVPELEEKFNIDEYSDFTMLNKPVVYMSIKEICDTHKLLIDHQDALAPERQDPLHELLDDLGEAPKLEDLIGLLKTRWAPPYASLDVGSTQYSMSAERTAPTSVRNTREIPLDEKDPNLEVERDKLAKTEVSLTLTNKFEVPEGDDTDMKALYTRWGNVGNWL